MSTRFWGFAVLAAAPLTAFAQTSQNISSLTTYWYISGRVMMEDGMPPPGPVRIQTICNGVAFLAGRTDSDGVFNFRLGGAGNGVVQDASVGGTDAALGRQAPSIASAGAARLADNTSTAQVDTSQRDSGATEFQQAAPQTYGSRIERPERNLNSCEIAAEMPGYWPAKVGLHGRRPLDTSSLGTLILRRVGPSESPTVSVTTLAAPKSARSAFEKGQKAYARDKFDEARTQFEKAVRAYPKYSVAWERLGQTQLRQGRLDDAARSFENSITADPKYVQPYLGLAAVQVSLKQWEKLISTTAQAIKLSPAEYPEAYYLDAIGNYNTHRMDAAEKSARTAERLDKLHRWPAAWHLLGLILQLRRDYGAAAAQFREYLMYAPQAADADRVRKLLARAESLSATP